MSRCVAVYAKKTRYWQDKTGQEIPKDKPEGYQKTRDAKRKGYQKIRDTNSQGIPKGIPKDSEMKRYEMKRQWQDKTRHCERYQTTLRV